MMRLITFVFGNVITLSSQSCLQQFVIKPFSYEEPMSWKRQKSPRTECHRACRSIERFNMAMLLAHSPYSLNTLIII